MNKGYTSGLGALICRQCPLQLRFPQKDTHVVTRAIVGGKSQTTVSANWTDMSIGPMEVTSHPGDVLRLLTHRSGGT